MTMTPLPDLSTESERASTAQVVMHVWPVVRNVVRRVVGADDVEYEDILQSALEQVLAAIAGAGLSGAALVRWAAVVARNVAVDVLRARSRERRVLRREEDVDALGGPSSPDPERIACARERLAQFAVSLRRLPAVSAEVVYSHDVLGCELAEISSGLGISVAAAQSRLVRGRRRMTSSPPPTSRALAAAMSMGHRAGRRRRAAAAEQAAPLPL